MRPNEAVTGSGDKYANDGRVPNDGIKVDGAGSLGTASITHKIEEMPYVVGNGFGSVPMDGGIPQTDKEGMKIMGESGAGATGNDIND
jgi:hypothetical protein